MNANWKNVARAALVHTHARRTHLRHSETGGRIAHPHRQFSAEAGTFL
jgi:hypothetical protein